jgi:hypothetical protein
MTHSLDFVGLHEKLFSLRHLITGTREFCRREQLWRPPQNDSSEDWDNYAGRLRYLVSNDLIEGAAKFRVIHDAARAQLSMDDFRDLECDVHGHRKIGSVLVGDFALTLREACNKVIHATTANLVFQNARNGKPYYLYSYWNGICQLEGSYFGKPWKVALDVYKWSDCMDEFLECVSGEVDW